MWIRFAWASLLRHWRKSAVAILSVASATMALLLFEGYMVDVERMYVDTFSKRQMLGDVVVEKAGLANPGKAVAEEGALDAQALEHLEAAFSESNRVLGSVRFLNFSGTLQGPGLNVGYSGVAYDVGPGREARKPGFEWNTLAGVPFDDETDQGVLLGKGLAELIGCAWEGKDDAAVNGVVGYSPVPRPFQCPSESYMFLSATEAGQSNAETLAVRGLTATGFAELDDRLVVLPLALARGLVDTTKISYVTVKASASVSGDAAALRSLKNFIETRMERSGAPVTVTPWQEHAFGDLYVRTMDFLGIFRNFVISVILAVAAMAVFSTFSKTVRERRKETATLRSFGFLPSHMLGLFATEAAFLGAAGALVGTALSALVIPGVNALGITYKAGFLSDPVPFRVAFAPVHAVFIWMLVVALSVGASVFAAWRGVRTPIVEGLAER